MHRTALVALVALAPALAVSSAHAGGEGPPGAALARPGAADVPARAVEKRWYGWKILAVDAASVAVLAAGADDGLFTTVGAGGLVLGAPAVHLSHGHGGRALGSLGLRVAAPTVVGLVALAACSNDDEEGAAFGCLGHFAMGFTAGAGAAMIIDLVRATDEIEASPPAAPALAPVLAVSEAGAQLGLAGRF